MFVFNPLHEHVYEKQPNTIQSFPLRVKSPLASIYNSLAGVFKLKSMMKKVTLTENNNFVMPRLHRVNESPCVAGKTTYAGPSCNKHIFICSAPCGIQ